jgi:hypothetical protein
MPSRIMPTNKWSKCTTSSGFNIEGWVQNEELESARENTTLIKSEMAEAANTEEEKRAFDEHWHF